MLPARRHQRLDTLSVRVASHLRLVPEQRAGPERLLQNEQQILRIKAGLSPLLQPRTLPRTQIQRRPALPHLHLISFITSYSLIFDMLSSLVEVLEQEQQAFFVLFRLLLLLQQILQVLNWGSILLRQIVQRYGVHVAGLLFWLGRLSYRLALNLFVGLLCFVPWGWLFLSLSYFEINGIGLRLTLVGFLLLHLLLL
jgi:hypothetical protein